MAGRKAIVAIWFESLRQDLHRGLRRLRQARVFAATVVLTLAVGIGATTAVVSLVEQVFLRSLPVAQPERLWRIGDEDRCCYRTGYEQDDWNFFSAEAYRHLQTHTPSLESLTAFQVGNAGLGVRRSGSSAPIATANGQFVSGNFFETFRVSAWRGRLLTTDDDRKGAPPAAAMAFHTWQEKFASDPTVVGAIYQINGRAFTIVGVAPPAFFGARVSEGNMPDFWLPLAMEPFVEGGTSRLDDPHTAWLDLIGRVGPQTNPKTAEAQLRVALRGWLASHAAEMTPAERARREVQTLHVAPGGAGISLMRATYQDGLRLLLGAAICVLLVGCANVANLLLARGLRNRDQTALCVALGASRARLVREALTDSLMLALFGGAAGVAVAYGATRLIIRLAFAGSPIWMPLDATPSVAILLFALALSVLTGVIFGVAPAWMTLRTDPMDALRSANRVAGGHRTRTQRTLVIVEAAVSLVLLSAAAMLGLSLRHLEHQNFGFELNGRSVVRVNTLLSSYTQEQLVPVLQEVERRLRSIPGVRGASAALYSPMSRSNWSHDVTIVGQPDRADHGPDDNASSGWARVMPGFFETLGDRILRGRPITDEDTARTRPVAVVNEAFARHFFGNEDPIGHHFGPASRQRAGTYEVIGVAADVRYFTEVTRPIGPMYFVPETQTTAFDEAGLEAREVWSHYPYNILIWAPGNPPGLDAQITKVLSAFDIPLYDIEPYADLVRQDFAQQTMVATLASMFAAIALALATVGLYGVTAYCVEQRTSEIGVRMALGAARRSVVVMVLREACWQLAIGLALGVPAAIGAGRLMATWLFGVTPWDPLIVTAAPLLLASAGLIAAAIPARRAASVDPARALRAQ